ncbi:MAG: DUF456 domain-containing protein [Phycisphaerae bacterium]
MEYLLLALLLLLALVGVALVVFQLPGTWLILAAAVGYDWYYDWNRLGWVWLLALGLVAVAAEVADTLAGLVAARRAGASRRAALGALAGGFLGMVLLSIPIPIPGLGAVVGGLLGCFAGAFIAEWSLNRKLADGARIGLFATLGKVVGLVAKTAAAVVLAGTTLSLAAWSLWSTRG